MNAELAGRAECIALKRVLRFPSAVSMAEEGDEGDEIVSAEVLRGSAGLFSTFPAGDNT